MVPALGPFVEQSGQIAKTPQFQGPKLKKIRNLILMFDLAATKQTTLSVKFVDRKGNPAKVDGVPEWLTDNSELLSLTPSSDGMSCECVAVGPLGTANITLTADADLGAGIVALVGTEQVNITAGDATAVTIDHSEPSEQ